MAGCSIGRVVPDVNVDWRGLSTRASVGLGRSMVHVVWGRVGVSDCRGTWGGSCAQG